MRFISVLLHLILTSHGHLRGERDLVPEPEMTWSLDTVKCENKATRDCSTCITRGPINLCGVKTAFEKAGQEVRGCTVSNLCGDSKTHEDQLPEKAKRFLNTSRGSFDWLASEPELIEAAKSGEDISPVAYPHAATDLREAINRSAGLTDKDVLVAGSISPWIESIVKMYSPRSITTSDYTERRIRSNLTKFVKVESLHSIQAKFDVVLSFSSIEHDGLGRYCDPINPDGDKAAMKEFHQLLRPGGMLFLGVPVDGSLKKTRVENNRQRIYSRDGLEALACGFDNVQIVDTHYGLKNAVKIPWKHQPWFILHRANHSA